MNLLKGSFVLKLAALISAIATYAYIHNEINMMEKEKKTQDPSYKLIKLTAKSLPIKIRLATEPPEGYQIVVDKVESEPHRLLVIGPEALVDEASSVETALVDVSESTKTISKKIPVESVAGIHLSGESYLVDVTVPIEKIVEKVEINSET